MEQITAPRGTKDILPVEMAKWRHVEATVRGMMEVFGYGEIRTPVFERAELFERGVGSDADIVKKEMYVFQDRGGRSLALRPEGTAAVVRAFIQHKMHAESELCKLFYIMPMFRYERPQAGRYRQHHQFGVEAIGVSHPALDAEIIVLALEIARKLGLAGENLKINSIGCEVCRPPFVDVLKRRLGESAEDFCDDCKDRIERNPIRVLDCKNKNCRELFRNAPVITDFLCDDCSSHHTKLKNYLSLLGVSFSEDPLLVRGLDYYTKTTFEVTVDQLGAQNSIIGGGRYDRLIDQLGGVKKPAVGFGSGIERVILALENQGFSFPAVSEMKAMILPLDEASFDKGLAMLYDLRKHGLSVDMALSKKSMKGLMKEADRSKAHFAIIIGEDELKNGYVTARNLKAGDQVRVADVELADFLSQA